MVILDPNYYFKYELMFRVDDPERQLMLLGKQEEYLLWIEQLLNRITSSCLEISELGKFQVNESRNHAAINLF